MADDYRVIGTPVVRPDGAEMISGQAIYGPDVTQPGMLWGKILRSPLPHARIRSIEVDKARALPGVTVISAGDVPDRRYGYAIQDDEIFAAEKVRHVGQPVAAAAAPDEERALEALSLIEVDYEELPAVFDAAEAVQDGAPLVHDELGPARSVYLASWKPVHGTNIIHQASHQRGDVEAALARADYMFEDTFHASQIHHSYMEPHATVAAVRGNTVTVWTCSQEVFELRTLLAELFGVPESRMRVVCTKVGGGFGGKIEPRLEPVTVALALHSRKPVKIVMTRAEEFTAAAGSTPATVTVKTGVMKDGTVVGRDVDFLWDTGAHAEGLAPSNRAMKDGIGPYRIHDIRVSSTLVYTNKMRGTQLRGLGVPEGAFAIESQLDMIAERLGIDPLELRLKNILEEGDINSIDDVVRSIGLRECLERVAESIGWGTPKPPNVGRGLAVIAKSPTTHSSISSAYVQFNEDGSAQVLVGASELGQGMSVVLCQIAAEVLGVPVESVGIASADTGTTPYDRGTFSSRVTFYTGMAVKIAAEDARNQLLELASRMVEVPRDDLAVAEERVVSPAHPELSLTFRAVLARAHASERPILGRGSYGGKGDYPTLPHKAQGKESVPGWKYAAQAVEAEIDEETGIVRVRRIASAHDVGKSLNPLSVDGQIVGGVVMGLGYALHERLQFDNGRIVNPSFMDYKIPSSQEIPEITPIAVEVPLPEGPFGAKGIGELAIVGIAPAIGNAIHDALGVRLKELPLFPERVLEAVESQRKSNGG
ncbi:MAG: xanthine dehydrogenase family protein molybdopterin-binding subunit [Deltaproteobacteria bacterium]|nr:xanthine dehydrogenase family protein molybdopterin-binding subunit [Deltaproteobacteria bacterium]